MCLCPSVTAQLKCTLLVRTIQNAFREVIWYSHSQDSQVCMMFSWVWEADPLKNIYVVIIEEEACFWCKRSSLCRWSKQGGGETLKDV